MPFNATFIFVICYDFSFLTTYENNLYVLITIYYNENEHTSKVSIKKIGIKKVFSFFYKN